MIAIIMQLQSTNNLEEILSSLSKQEHLTRLILLNKDLDFIEKSTWNELVKKNVEVITIKSNEMSLFDALISMQEIEYFMFQTDDFWLDSDYFKKAIEFFSYHTSDSMVHGYQLKNSINDNFFALDRTYLDFDLLSKRIYVIPGIVYKKECLKININLTLETELDIMKNLKYHLWMLELSKQYSIQINSEMIIYISKDYGEINRNLCIDYGYYLFKVTNGKSGFFREYLVNNKIIKHIRLYRFFIRCMKIADIFLVGLIRKLALFYASKKLDKVLKKGRNQ
jgi:hypothetical protein